MLRTALVFFLIVSATIALAQRRPPTSAGTGGTEITVRVVLDNSRPAGEQLRVQLLTSTSIPVAEYYTDSRSEVRFAVKAGSYRVKVTGIGIEETTSEIFSIDNLAMSSFQMVTVKRTADAVAADKAAPPVSAAELNIPAKARKEFDKGRELLSKGKKDEALEHFKKAADIYPQYAAAFDAIGTIQSETSIADSKQYFLNAIAADKQYRPPYMHLAKAYISEKNYPEAEKLLNVAVPLDPLSAEAMFLLAYAQVKQQKYDLAEKSAARTHQLEHRDYALIHFVAAECFAKTGRPADAAAQYQQYLNEAPMGPSAEIAKASLKAMQEQVSSK
jgi:tetratricopeptide (TPR) repeat protein